MLIIPGACYRLNQIGFFKEKVNEYVREVWNNKACYKMYTLEDGHQTYDQIIMSLTSPTQRSLQMELHHILMSWDLVVTGNESLMVMDPSSLYEYVIHPRFQMLRGPTVHLNVSWLV